MGIRLNKSNKLIIGTAILFIVLVIRLFNLQILNDKYKITAENNALIYRKQYPVRGLIYDRGGKILVGNKYTYDIIVTPVEVEKFDTLELCSIFSLNPEDVKKTFNGYRENRRKIGYQSQTFLKQVSLEQYNRFMEMSYKFPGFSTMPRTVREYPYNAGGNLLGYINEVDGDFLKKNPEYEIGDYVGRTGMEATFEQMLRGENGYNIFLRDASNKVHSSYMEGEYDKAAIAGKDVICTIDAELQNYGELLMQNKVGSIIAIEPSTGEILTMVSYPGVSVDKLAEINKYYGEIATDPLKPLYNRAVMSPYPPGSVLKLVNGLIALEEGAVDVNTRFSCSYGFHYGSFTVGCHGHPSPVNLIQAIQTSCNSYFCNTFREIINNPRYNNNVVAFNKWREKMESFGFGNKLGSDFPAEQAGSLPTAEYYNKIHNGRWNYLSIISLAIGQGEMGCTPLQLANMAATIANRGYFYTPHIFKGAVEGDVFIDGTDFNQKREVLVDPKHFEPVIEGMYQAVNGLRERGSNANIAAIQGIDLCGKTGTSQNHPNKEDHSVFVCFAPRENPQIAVAVYVEHGTWGARWAAPIASLLVEKYLKGEIPENRKYLETRMIEGNLLDLQ